MARLPRLNIAGMPQHVLQRGNNKAACFLTDTDRAVYLSMLCEVRERFPCEVHAFVLMTNHVHMLATPRQAQNMSHVMQHLGQRYVQYFNRTHGRTGSLWEGRFRSSLVDTDGYFLVCQRYIELNPVRAGMVANPAEHAWSSFRANALGAASALVRPHPVYAALGKDAVTRRHAYAGLFEEALTPERIQEIRDAINGGFVLGSKGFAAVLERLMQRRVARRRKSHRREKRET